jgi:hypothetical protein
MSYGFTTIIILAAVGILCVRLARARSNLKKSIGDDADLIANRNVALLIGEHFVLSDKHADPMSRSAGEGPAKSDRPLKIAS